MSERYDIIIVGASIAGLYTGMKLAEAGKQVCVVDRKKVIGLPVRCGEATGSRAELARFFHVDEAWIARDLLGIAVHVNDDRAYTKKIADFGVVLHRDLFEKALADRAIRSGATCLLRTTVSGLLWHNGWCGGVRIEDGREIAGSLVIGADGCESTVGRWAGLTNTLPLSDAFSSIQYRLVSDFCNDGMLHFFVGSGVIPGGYLWIFPKTAKEISVGAGVYRGNGTIPKVRDVLDRFIEKNIPDAPRSHLITGCAPLSMCPRILYASGVLVVGDAARQVNPLTAGGIMNALEAADLAVRAILNAMPDKKGNDISMRYSNTWAKTQRRQQKIYYLFKEVFLECTDRDIGMLIEKIFILFNSSGTIDRSKPFTFPLVALLQLVLFFFGKCRKHLNLLWR